MLNFVRCLVFVGWMLPGVALAVCNPAQSPKGSVGCLPSLTSPQLTDTLMMWRASAFPDSLNQMTVANLFASPGPIGSGTPSTGAYTTLTSTGGALNGTLGATTPNTGSFTTLAAGATTLSGLLTITNVGSAGLLIQNTGAAGAGNYTSATIKSTGASAFGPALVLDGSAITGGHLISLISTGNLDGGSVGAGSFAIFDNTANLYRLTIGPTGKWVSTVNTSGTLSGSYNSYSFVSTDSADASGVVSGVAYLGQFLINLGGSAVNGGRTAVVGLIEQTSDTVNALNAQFVAIQGYSTARHNTGGAVFYGMNAFAAASSTATNIGGLIGGEIDVGSASAQQSDVEVGLQLVHTNGTMNSGKYASNGFSITDQVGVAAGAKWKVGFNWGSYAAYNAIHAAGYAMQAQSGQATNPHMAGGIDFGQVIFDGVGEVGGAFAFRSPGASIQPGTNGGLFQAGYGSLTSAATGVLLDANYQQMTGTPTVAAAGTGWVVQDLAGDAYGNIIRVLSLSGSGVATLSVIQRGWQTTPPANPVTFAPLGGGRTTGGNGTGLTLNLTWTPQTGVTIGSASAKIALYGATPIVKATPTGACAGNTGCQALRDALGNLGAINTGSISN